MSFISTQSMDAKTKEYVLNLFELRVSLIIIQVTNYYAKRAKQKKKQKETNKIETNLIQSSRFSTGRFPYSNYTTQQDDFHNFIVQRMGTCMSLQHI